MTAPLTIAEVLQLIVDEAPPTYPTLGLVYRHFDTEGVLLYVGSTDEYRFRARQQAHGCGARWWIYVARVEVQRTLDRMSARSVERAAIFSESPVFNRTPPDEAQQRRERDYVRQTPLPAPWKPDGPLIRPKYGKPSVLAAHLDELLPDLKALGPFQASLF